MESFVALMLYGVAATETKIIMKKFITTNVGKIALALISIAIITPLAAQQVADGKPQQQSAKSGSGQSAPQTPKIPQPQGGVGPIDPPFMS